MSNEPFSSEGAAFETRYDIVSKSQPGGALAKALTRGSIPIHIDPDNPFTGEGGTTLDVLQITKEDSAFAIHAAGGDTAKAFSILADKQKKSGITNGNGQVVRMTTQDTFHRPEIVGLALEPLAMDEIPNSFEEPKLPSSPVAPTQPQPAVPIPAAVTARVSPTTSANVSDEELAWLRKIASDTIARQAAVPSSQPQWQQVVPETPQPQRRESSPQPAAAPVDWFQLGLPWLSKEPQQPKVHVIFHLSQGLFRVRYHNVSIEDDCLTLISDNLCDGDQFVPKNTEVDSEGHWLPLRIEVPSLDFKGNVIVLGMKAVFWRFDILILSILPEAPPAFDPGMQMHGHSDLLGTLGK